MNQLSSDSTPFVQWLQQGNRPIVLGIVVLLISIIVFYAINQRTGSQMCNLFEDCEISKIERQRILLALGTAGMEGYQIENGKILVPSGERARYLAQIEKHNALPRALSREEELQPNPLLPSSQLKRLELERKKQHVSNMILELPYVEEAWFEMDTVQSASMFEQARQSAVVMVQSKDNSTITRRQAETIQQLVAAAFAGINREQVAIIDSNAGIGYHNLHDTEQSQLIELVNWTRSRREHYLQQLTSLFREYPGLQIEVEVDRRQVGADTPQKDKIASERPEKLAGPPALDRHQTGHMGLNSKAEINVPIRNSTNANSESAIQTISHHEVVMQLAPQRLRRLDQLPAQVAKAEKPFQEAIRVTVRVPYSSLSQIELPEIDDSISAKQKFQRVKNDIVSKIEKLIPAKSLADTQPVTVLLTDAAVAKNGLSQKSSIAGMFQLYWPVACGLVLALFSVYWSRVQNQNQSAISTSPDVPPPASERDRLQTQLSNLIDKDPAAAATVIKKWIRQAD